MKEDINDSIDRLGIFADIILGFESLFPLFNHSFPKSLQRFYAIYRDPSNRLEFKLEYISSLCRTKEDLYSYKKELNLKVNAKRTLLETSIRLISPSYIPFRLPYIDNARIKDIFLETILPLDFQFLPHRATKEEHFSDELIKAFREYFDFLISKIESLEWEKKIVFSQIEWAAIYQNAVYAGYFDNYNLKKDKMQAFINKHNLEISLASFKSRVSDFGNILDKEKEEDINYSIKSFLKENYPNTSTHLY